jgi:hypothetical protein
MKKIKMFFGLLLAAGLLVIVFSGFSRPGKAKKNTAEAGTILGIVVPLTVKTAVYAISVTDTIAAAITDTTNGAYLLKDVPSGNYALVFVPADHDYLKNSTRAFVSEGQITIADTIWLHK